MNILRKSEGYKCSLLNKIVPWMGLFAVGWDWGGKDQLNGILEDYKCLSWYEKDGIVRCGMGLGRKKTN